MNTNTSTARKIKQKPRIFLHTALYDKSNKTKQKRTRKHF